MKTYYIRSVEGFCLVKVPDEIESLDSYSKHMLAVHEAEMQEPSICPAGTKLIQEVVEQEDFWYDKKWTEEQAQQFRRDPEMLSRIK